VAVVARSELAGVMLLVRKGCRLGCAARGVEAMAASANPCPCSAMEVLVKGGSLVRVGSGSWSASGAALVPSVASSQK